MTSTAYYYKMVDLAARAAKLLGREADVVRHARLASEIRAAFREKFFDAETGRVANDEQTALAAILYQGLATPDEAPRILARLKKQIADYDHHLDTGVHGTKYALHVLADYDEIDVAYRAVTQETFPSWGDMLNQGATTFWESWKGGASLNHAYLSLVSHWFHRGLAGIRPDPDEPGFRHVIIRPGVPRDLREAASELHTIRGLVKSHWAQDPAGVHYNVTLPSNTRGTIKLTAVEPGRINYDGKPIAAAKQVRVIGQEGSRVVIEVAPGDHAFFVAR